MENYLIVNTTNASDGGEYVFNVTSRYSTGSQSADRNVTVSIGEFASSVHCVSQYYHTCACMEKGDGHFKFLTL